MPSKPIGLVPFEVSKAGSTVGMERFSGGGAELINRGEARLNASGVQDDKVRNIDL